MKRIVLFIALSISYLIGYSQVNCLGTAPSTINLTDKVGICNGNLQRTATVSQLIAAGIDTTKVGRIEQGRGTAPIFMYFNGTSWVRNDTSYIPRSGASNITGGLKSNQGYFEVGLNTNNNQLQFSDEVYTQIFSGASGTGITGLVKAISTSLGTIELSLTNASNASYSRQLQINGSNTATPDLSFKFDKGIAWYNGDYSAQMETSQNLIPSLKKVKQLISDSLSSGGGGSVTSVSGTTNRITSTGGTTPVIDIDAAYVGQNSIQTLGNVTSGAWTSSTKIGIAYGGTNADLSATGGTGQVLKQNTVGGNVTVGQLAASDLSNGTTGTGSVVLATSPVIAGTMSFSSPTNAGLKLNNLTTAQLDALAVKQEGMVAQNISKNTPVYYDGTNFVAIKDKSTYNVRDFGALGNGVADDKAAIDACIAAAPAGSIIYFPNGTYLVSAALAPITKTLQIVGTGENTVIQNNSTTADLFVFTGTNVSSLLYYILIRDIHIRSINSSPKTSGSGIKMTYTAFSTISNVTVSNFYECIDLENTMIININSGCRIQEFTNAGISIINNAGDGMTDFGDSFIDNILVSSSSNVISNYGIFQTNSGGLKVSNCKFIKGGSFDFYYPYFYTGTATTVILSITSCSFDSFARTAITLNKGTGAFYDVTITGNTFEGGNASYNTLEADGIIGLSITGNSFIGQTTNYAIKLNNVNTANINNSYYSYNVPINTIGATINISGNLNTTYRSPSTPSNGGQVTYLQSVLTAGTVQQSIGVDMGGYYSGSGGTTTARTAVVLDNTTGTARWGVDQNGTMWVGATSTSYGMKCSQSGNADFVGSVGVGTTTPASKLSVTTGLGVGSTYAGGSTAPSNSVIVEGQIGIGTATPSGKLEIKSSYDATFHRPNSIYFTDATNSNLKGTIGINRNSAAGADKEYLGIQAIEEGVHYMNILLNPEGGNVGIGTTATSAMLEVNGTAIFKSYTAATLPVCAAGVYQRATVTDALAPVYDATVVGGGARVIEVLCNGTNWVCH